jgi:hypothetical protein
MDAQRFDGLARALARRTSRRTVLRGAAGGAVAGALVGAGVRPAGAQTCAPALTACGGECVDLMTDMENCGACGRVCQSGLVGVACIEGECHRVTCPAALTDCGTGDGPRPYLEHCFDLATDPNNCGECGNVCASGLCAAGVCAQATDGSGELGDLGDACSEVLPCRAPYVCAGGVCSEAADDGGSVTGLPSTGAGMAAGQPRAGFGPAALAAGAVALGAAALRRVAPRPRES